MAKATPVVLLNRKRVADEPLVSQAHYEAAIKKDREESRRHSVIPALSSDVAKAKHVSDGGDNDSWWLFNGARRVLKEERVSVVVRDVKMDAEQARYSNTTGRLEDLPHREYVAASDASLPSMRALCFQSRADSIDTKTCALGASVDYWNIQEHIKLLDEMCTAEKNKKSSSAEEEHQLSERPVAVLLIGKLKHFERTSNTKLMVQRAMPLYSEDEARFHELSARLYAARLGGV